MFDNLTPEAEGQTTSSEAKKTETPLGQSNNIPANLASTFGASIGAATPPKPTSSGLGEEFNQRMQKLQEKGKKRGIKFSRIGIIAGSIIGLVMMGVVYYLLTEVISYTEKAQESSVNVPAIGRESREEKKDKIINLELSEEMTSCVDDEDCQVAQAQCCPCEKGGALTAINKNFLTAWQEEFDKKCAQASCDEASTCPTGHAYCDGMKCRFVVIDSPVLEEGGSASTTEACVGDNCPINSENQGIEEGGFWVENPALTDTDQDGILDAEEMDFGTDLGKPDTDGDGILDGEEIKLKSSPIKPDTDEDGILDKDEITLGTDPNNPDTDADGFSDGSEIINGYNPLGPGLLNKEQPQQ